MIHIGLTDFTSEDKIIEIRDKGENVKAKYAISSTDKLKHTLMGEHYIEISFVFDRYVAFNRSDYILWNGLKYTLRTDYIPEQENKYKYNYTLKFEAIEMLFQDIQFYYLNQNSKESDWRLAGNPEYFIKIVVDNANRYFQVADFQVGVVEPTEVKDIAFDTNTNTFDALTRIAEAYESEWYMTGRTINLVKKISFGTEVDFETEVSVLSMSRSEGENSTKYTRILALGSTRNLSSDYRAGSAGGAIYSKRLCIPASKGDVIDAYPNMSPEEVVEGTVIFDEVYPKRVGTIEAVGTIEYTDTNEDTGEVTKWNAFKIKDSGINFKEEYLLPEEELRLTFQSGNLNGFHFALKFHKDRFSSSDNSQYFEIVRSEDYGTKLPNETMKPKAGDKYTLYGFNIALVSDQYVPAAEKELYNTASSWLQKQFQDTSVYECPTVVKHFADNEMDIEIGQKVRLIKDLGGGKNLILKSNVPFDRSVPASNYILKLWDAKTSELDVSQDVVLTVKITVFKGYNAKVWYSRLVGDNNPNYATGMDETRIVSITLKPHASLISSGLLYLYNWGYNSSNEDKMTNKFIIHWIKLEKGNKATDWTPAPEDVDGAFRSSRIMGFEKKLVNKYDATYTVGDNSAYSRLAAIEKDLKELQYAGIAYENAGNGGVYLIKQFDRTASSDFNAYSAKASDAKFLNRQIGGKVNGETVFEKKVKAKEFGSDQFGNETFTSGQFGSGFRTWLAANGQSYAEFDNLMVRREMVVNALTIAEIKSVGGQVLLSLANMYCNGVTDSGTDWKCSFDDSNGTILNQFAVEDLVICRKFNGDNIKYYWAKVTGIGPNYINISKSDKDGSGIPAIGDEIIQFGNKTKVARQSAILLSAYGSNTPSITQYSGVNSYDLTGKDITVISPNGNKFTGSFAVSTNGTTVPIYKERGLFIPGSTYYLDDRVSYLGAYWVCIANTTKLTPVENSTFWRKDTLGAVDVNNAISDLQIGGRNYIPSSLYTTTYWDKVTKQWVVPASAGAPTIIKAFNIPEDGTYTLQAKISKTAVSAGVRIVVNGSSAKYLGVNQDTNGVFELFSDTRLYTKGDTIMLQAYARNSSNTASDDILVKEIQLEMGTKATDWSSAPEDVQQGILEAQTVADKAQKETEKVRAEYKADFVVLDNKITSKVSQTDFSSLGNRVSTTESSIIQQSGQISSTVSKIEGVEANSVKGLIYCKGTGNSRVANQVLKISDNIVYDTRGRGLRLTVVNRGTLSVISSEQYDVYGSADARNNLADKLNLLSHDVIVVLTSCDAIIIDDNLASAMTRCGGTGVKLTYRDSYSLIGIPKIGRGQGIEVYYIHDTSMPDAEITTRVVDGMLQGISSNINTALNEATTAQATADSKNKSYYQGPQPSVPTGGHKIGDLWYKTSLVDSSGNVNADTSKNIYQLQYRWNGTDWMQINWSASKSKIEQTDNRISTLVSKTGIDALGNNETIYSKINQATDQVSSLVSKTGVDSLGNGETLYSKINQTATKFEVEVNGITIGGSNLIVYSRLESGYINISNGFTTSPSGADVHDPTFYPIQAGRKSLIATVYEHLTVGTGTQGYILFYSGTESNRVYLGQREAWCLGGSNGTTKLGSTLYTIPDNATWFRYYMIHRDLKAKIEYGNKATDWSPSPIDIPNQVGSMLSIDKNKITLASKNIELNGDTVAEAIKTSTLNVGNGNFRVDPSGQMSAKGANINGALHVEGSNQITVADASGSTRVSIKPSNITPRANIGGFSEEYLINTGGAAVSDSVFNGTKTWTGAAFTLPQGRVYDLQLPSITLNASIGDLSTDRLSYASFEYRLVNLTTNMIQVIESGTADLGFYISGGGAKTIPSLSAGKYALQILLSAITSSVYTNEARFSIPAGAKVLAVPLNQFTEMGLDGFVTALANNKYIHISTDGIYFRMEGNMIRLTGAGIQKSTNAGASWTNL